jgi:hypothetical protein
MTDHIEIQPEKPEGFDSLCALYTQPDDLDPPLTLRAAEVLWLARTARRAEDLERRLSDAREALRGIYDTAGLVHAPDKEKLLVLEQVMIRIWNAVEKEA